MSCLRWPSTWGMRPVRSITSSSRAVAWSSSLSVSGAVRKAVSSSSEAARRAMISAASVRAVWSSAVYSRWEYSCTAVRGGCGPVIFRGALIRYQTLEWREP